MDKTYKVREVTPWSEQFPGIIAEDLLTKVINASINLQYNAETFDVSYDQKLKFFDAFEIFNSSFAYNYNYSYDFVKSETEKNIIKMFLKKSEFVNELFDTFVRNNFGLEDNKKFFQENLTRKGFKDLKKSVDFVVRRIVDKSTEDVDESLNNILQIVVKNWKLEKPCGSTLWEQIIHIYNLGVRTIIQGYSLVTFRLKFQKFNALWDINYESRIDNIVENYKNAISLISRKTRYFLRTNNKVAHKINGNCPPKKWELGSHYEKFRSIELKFGDNSHLKTNPDFIHRFPRVSTNLHCADTEKNEVVTGIKFELYNNTLYPTIQVGKLENGSIDPWSVYWQPKNISHGTDDTAVINVFADETFVDMGGVKLPSGHFVTGLKFELADDVLRLVVGASTIEDDGLNPSITEPDWDTERNIEDDWINFLEIFDDDYYYDPSFEPVLDIRSLTTDPPMPLGGLGIRDRSAKMDSHDSDGALRFISPYFVVYDFYQFFSNDVIDEFDRTVFLF
uniref:Uncharacterized protein n=1 Tax=Cotesia congregata TaxID=51543 RepID=S6CWR8_COTCN|nr:hypothetical protein CcPL9.011 [Cotesia congregata]